MHFETLCAVLPHDAFTAIEAALKKGVEAKNLLKAADVSVSLGEFFGPPGLSSLAPYYWKTPKTGAKRLADLESLTTRISFRIHIFQKL